MARYDVKKVVFLGLVTSLAMSLNILEAAIPIPAPFPGAKLGLANVVSLFVIIRYGLGEAILVNILRTTLTSLILGTLLTPTFYLSFSGGIASAFTMGIVYRYFSEHFSMVSISVVGSVTHSVTQVIVASFIADTTGLFLYLPYFLLFSVPTGIFVGLVVMQILRHNRFP